MSHICFFSAPQENWNLDPSTFFFSFRSNYTLKSFYMPGIRRHQTWTRSQRSSAVSCYRATGFCSDENETVLWRAAAPLGSLDLSPCSAALMIPHRLPVKQSLPAKQSQHQMFLFVPPARTFHDFTSLHKSHSLSDVKGARRWNQG